MVMIMIRSVPPFNTPSISPFNTPSIHFTNPYPNPSTPPLSLIPSDSWVVVMMRSVPLLNTPSIHCTNPYLNPPTPPLSPLPCHPSPQVHGLRRELQARRQGLVAVKVKKRREETGCANTSTTPTTHTIDINIHEQYLPMITSY